MNDEASASSLGARGRGGSAARRALRKSGPKAGAVRAGMPGGTYRPLSDRDMQRVHDAALDVLEKLGVGEPIPEILEVALPRGCSLNDRGRLCFPRALVEDILAGACRSYTAYGVSPEHDLEIGGDHVNFATAGEAIKVLDFHSGEYRPLDPARPLRFCAPGRSAGACPLLRPDHRRGPTCRTGSPRISTSPMPVSPVRRNPSASRSRMSNTMRS